MRAVVFDIGGVLEIVDPPTWADAWRDRLGLTQREWDAATARVDPDDRVVVGALDEAGLRAAYRRELGLTPDQVDELLRDVWDWYCGRLDEPLVAFARGLRPAVRTGILSNSADGARREEAARWALPDLVDDIVYSHEVGLAKPDPAIYHLCCERLDVSPQEVVFVDDVVANVDAARDVGMAAVQHRRSDETIDAVRALLA